MCLKMHHLDPSFHHPPHPPPQLTFRNFYTSLWFSSPNFWFLWANETKSDRVSAERGLSKKLLRQLFPSWRRNEAQRDLLQPRTHTHARTQQLVRTWTQQDTWTHRLAQHFLLANFWRLFQTSDDLTFFFSLSHMWMRRLTGRAVNAWIRQTSGWRIRQPGRGRIRRTQTHPGPGSERN